MCYTMMQNFLDGTPCEGGGTCHNGNCDGASIANEILTGSRTTSPSSSPSPSSSACSSCSPSSSCCYSAVRRRRTRPLPRMPKPPPPGWNGARGGPFYKHRAAAAAARPLVRRRRTAAPAAARVLRPRAARSPVLAAGQDVEREICIKKCLYGVSVRIFLEYRCT